MKLLDPFYTWAIGKQVAFTTQFQENEALYNQARAFWMKLDNHSLECLIIPIAVSLILVLAYYYVYTNSPGRKYKPSHWALFGIGAVLLSLIATILYTTGILHPKFADARQLLWSVSGVNVLYSALWYLLLSFVVCNLPFDTNAYRLLKLKSRKNYE